MLTVQAVLNALEAAHGGKCYPPIRNDVRWKAPWPMGQGNTVKGTINRNGIHIIHATGRAAEVTRTILGPEDYTKVIGTNGTKYLVAAE